MNPTLSTLAAGVCLVAGLSLSVSRSTVEQQIVTGTYGTCNPLVDDKLAGAEARSPSDCEVKFDADVRRAFTRAFDGVTRAFASGMWIVRLPEAKAITTQARHTEKSPYRMDFAHEGGYVISMQMAPTNPAFAGYRQEVQDSLNSPQPDAQKIGAAMSRVEFETKAHIVAVINYPYGIADTFTPERTALTIDGAAFAFFSPHVQAPTGGDIGSSQPTAFVWLGRWTPPAIRKNGDGSEHIELHAAFDRSAPPLSVQNIQIRITGAEPLVRKILAAVDWTPLRQLLPK